MKVHYTNTIEVEMDAVKTYKPQTQLGKRLIEIRARIISSGIPLLPADQIEREVASCSSWRLRLTK